jgi:nucleoside-diphosphate-sugar epimerase
VREGTQPFTLVVGTGYVGRRFLARRDRTSALGLSRTAAPASLPIEAFDLDTAAALPRMLPDDYVVLYTVPPSQLEARDTRLERLLGLLQVAPRRFVYISTTGVYGDCSGAIVTEDRLPAPDTDRGKRRLEAERAVTRWSQGNGTGVVILRVPGIYGPGRLGIGRIRAGTPVLAESAAGPGNRIHVEDLLRCCEAAASVANPPGIYNVGDDDFRSATWFANEVARQCALPPPPQVDRDTAMRQFSEMRLSFLRESRRIDTRRMRETLGVLPLYTDAADGIRVSLAQEDR